MENRKKGGEPMPNESFEKDGAVIGDKDDEGDKEKLNRAKTITDKTNEKETEKKKKKMNKKRRKR